MKDSISDFSFRIERQREKFKQDQKRKKGEQSSIILPQESEAPPSSLTLRIIYTRNKKLKSLMLAQMNNKKLTPYFVSANHIKSYICPICNKRAMYCDRCHNQFYDSEDVNCIYHDEHYCTDCVRDVEKVLEEVRS